MGKVLVTESELRQLIAESVKEIMNEDWQTRQAKKATKRQNRYDKTMGKINQINQLGDPAERETNKYNRLQRRAGRQAMKNGAAFQQQATDNADQLATVRRSLNSVCEALGITDGDINKAIAKISEINAQNQQLTAQVDELTKKLAAANTSITKQQNTIKDLNAQLAQKAQATPQQPVQQQQPLNPQTDGAKAAAYGNNTQLASR